MKSGEAKMVGGLESFIPKTAVEPPITPKHAEKTMTYLKNSFSFLVKPIFVSSL